MRVSTRLSHRVFRLDQTGCAARFIGLYVVKIGDLYGSFLVPAPHQSTYYGTNDDCPKQKPTKHRYADQND
jgi:hypothetical protein